MNSKFQNQPDFKQAQQVQSFHEPALRLLNQMYERNKQNLRSKGYDENNAAITKVELSELMARQFRITQWLASQIVASLINAGLVESFGGYVKPKAGGL
ncbi:hypothetical protein [Acinetobacter ursingii]|uniref:Uncharacterized protein n=1 Tax=Acinetobacter ursingii TaxID=108980 RepID=A0A3D2SQS0_9GAMM|nr:hypothetical protein [Acinetobacter ursingii]MCH2004067.1 hypothetical protein [Acinetobacter ursingii]MCU4608184.1 hypothetical protein [Acinetobacter ursingii]HCK31827.1 hypothetical protein [Acinetobacter ursingii]